jgi:hypothetical protein
MSHINAVEAEAIQAGKSNVNSSYLLLNVTACLRRGLIIPSQ